MKVTKMICVKCRAVDFPRGVYNAAGLIVWALGLLLALPTLFVSFIVGAIILWLFDELLREPHCRSCGAKQVTAVGSTGSPPA